MYVLEIVADNIYSFKNKTQVRFDSPSATLVGPNNAGKSNVFRLLRLLIAELDHPGRELVLSDTFASGKKASVSVKLALTEMESLGIFSFLDFYFSNKFSDFRFVESHILSPYLRNITVDIEWEQTHYSTHEHLASTLNFNFDQLGFSFIRLSTGEWRIRSKGASYHIHKEGIECFQKLTDSVEQFGSTLDNILASSSKSSSIGLEESLPLKARFTDSRELAALTNISNYLDKDYLIEETTFSRFLSSILKRGLIFTSTRSVRTLEDIRYAPRLEGDGSNLTQFLYSLKMSPNLDERKRFESIRSQFNDVFKASELSFDVNVRYDEKSDEAKNSSEKQIPKSISICIINERLKKQFYLDQSSSGIAETLFLISLAFGLKDKVILLDEPAINLHLLLLKSLIRLIVANKFYTNQFIIITHSSELVHLLIFELGSEIFYIQKLPEQNSEIKSLDESMKKWVKNMKPKLRYLLDTRIFFARTVVLTEGESDWNFLVGIAQYFSSQNHDMD